MRPAGHVGHHFYWQTASHGGPLPALFYHTPLRDVARSLLSVGGRELPARLFPYVLLAGV